MKETLLEQPHETNGLHRYHRYIKCEKVFVILIHAYKATKLLIGVALLGSSCDAECHNCFLISKSLKHTL